MCRRSSKLKRNSLHSHRRGSILLTVMGFLGLLCILTGALIRLAGHRRGSAFRYSRRVRLRWMANGELDALCARLESGTQLLKEREYTVKTEDGEIRVSVKKGDVSGRTYLLRAEASTGGFSRVAERGLEAFFPSDHVITVETNWQVLSQHLPSVLGGRVYVNGSCAVAVTESGPLELVGADGGKQPLWTVFGGFRPLSLDGVGPLTLFRAELRPFSKGIPYSGADRGIILAGKDAGSYSSGSTAEIQDSLPGRAFVFPGFKTVFQGLLTRCESQFRFMGNDRGSLKIQRILNPKLVAKDMIAVGDGSRFIFEYSPRDRKIDQVYFRRVRQGQPLDTVRIDPVADADAIGYKFFNARMGRLYLPGAGSKVYMQLQKEAFAVLGRVSYGTIDRSYCSVDHPFAKFYIDSLSEMQRYREGEHYKVDYLRKEITMTDADLISRYYTFLSERGDGRRLGFQVPLTLRYRYVYVNGRLEENVKREGETLMFATPPPDNAAIGFMVRVPRIFGLRQVPPAGVGIFVDRVVKALRIDLGQMQHYPAKGLIVSDRPLYVTGRAAFPVTIVSSSDIYMDNINHDADDPKPVGIVSGRAVWIENSSMKTNFNKRVYIHSQADRIYTTATGAVTSTANKKYLKGTGIIAGSVQLAGRIQNSFVKYPDSLRGPDAHLFSKEPFFSVQYRYDPWFADPRNLPPGILPLIRQVWWKP